MPCTNNATLVLSSATSNAQFQDAAASRALDHSGGFGNHFGANTVAATNTAAASANLGGYDNRASGEAVAFTADLGGVQCVQTIGMQWHYPSPRQYLYTLWTSTDGEMFTQQGGARTSAGQASVGLWEDPDIGGVQASHIQVRCTGNTDAAAISRGWVVINKLRANGDQLVLPPNGYTITITGNGVNQTHEIFGQVGDNNRPLTPSPSLPAGTYSYTISGPGYTSCSGTFVVEADTFPRPIDCVKHLPWSLQPITISRDCFFEGMTDKQASAYVHSVTNTLPEGATFSFDEQGNFIFTPAPSQEPTACGSSSVVVLPNIDDGED